jgi:hypothetical protein
MEYKLITHDKLHFYKYYSPSAAKLVLDNLTVKWSSPILFNDPFDFQVNFDFSFKMEEMIEPFLDEMTRIVFSEDEPVGNPAHPLFAIMLHSRLTRHRSTPQIFREFMRPSAIEGAINSQESIIRYQPSWKEFCKSFRIFCVSEVHDDLLMWAHYAQNHEGIVIKFKCLRELDRPLCAAVPVNYQKKFPVIVDDINKYIRHLTGQEELPFDDLFKYFASTKSDHWSYEKEWRCIGAKRPGSTELYELEKIIPEEVESVFYGCRISERDRLDIEALIDRNTPEISVFTSEKDSEEYGLIFDQIR